MIQVCKFFKVKCLALLLTTTNISNNHKISTTYSWSSALSGCSFQENRKLFGGLNSTPEGLRVLIVETMPEPELSIKKTKKQSSFFCFDFYLSNIIQF